ncbi:hypothetical protein NC652_003646 [Populus alba x Populus x berolinensis]|uniref:Uncharacterized protein n=1 Tax=Populus alba x Populus x berolinensis TaxID=444605 RepID=A0AAD6RS57_9ROSI|nr:hypothetical protein NC651_003559 [Populus alba x Populus x berolinensis]KAJ6965830.1 hypothetical protein NC652_003646 [Populus alba x Populus x berolinensis]KAJ7014175.1 hypothetical protein NC653_003707 [Populus alba x Populus x berolinensis]
MFESQHGNTLHFPLFHYPRPESKSVERN